MNPVATEFEVGRAGAAKVFVLLSAGHRSLPQARSVGQQPPPNDAGQDRKPDEQTRTFGESELLDGLELLVVVVVIIFCVVVVVVMVAVVSVVSVVSVVAVKEAVVVAVVVVGKTGTTIVVSV